MTATTVDNKPKPPYGSWKTWKTFLESLKNTAIPSHIDPSIMPKMSGSAKSQIKGTARFLDLTTIGDAVTPRLRSLITAFGTEHWKTEWAEVFFDGYQPIIGDLNTDTATLKQLVDRFRDAGGVSGSVLRKAVRFYLDAAAETGLTFSPHFKTRGLSIVSGDRAPRPNGSPKKTAPAGKPDTGGTTKQHHVPGPDDFLIQLPGRAPLTIPLPANLTDAEWFYINNQVTAYMKLRKSK